MASRMSLDEGCMRSSMSCFMLATGGNVSEVDCARTDVPPRRNTAIHIVFITVYSQRSSSFSTMMSSRGDEQQKQGRAADGICGFHRIADSSALDRISRFGRPRPG